MGWGVKNFIDRQLTLVDRSLADVADGRLLNNVLDEEALDGLVLQSEGEGGVCVCV